MAKTIALALVAFSFVLAACASAPHFDMSRPTRDLFGDYLQAFNVSFPSPKEKLARFNVFSENLKKIAELNAAAKAAGRNTEFGLNAYSLHSEAEFSAMYLGRVMPNIPGLRPSTPATAEAIAALPTSFDWRTANPPVITGIKNQGQCGDCWAFSTTGNVEGVWAKAKHPLVSLSEQQLTDCSTANDGCNGGEMSLAFEYIIKVGGIESEDDYPFKGVQGKCKFDKTKIAAKISSWVSVQKQVQQMQAYLVANSPIAIAVDATSWQYYNKGILHSNCGTSLDHGVLLVGYGVDTSKNNMPYWIIKNSWGKSWGMEGFIEVEITDDLCGIQKQPVSSVA